MSLNDPGITYIPSAESPQFGIRGYATPGGWARGYQTAPYEFPQGDQRIFNAPPIPQAFPDAHAYNSYVVHGVDRTLPAHTANVRGWSAPTIPMWGTGAGPGDC